jgi:hypothetical protein
MRMSATVRWAIVASTLVGCSTMRSAKERFPGAIDQNPKAVTRVYHASATRVAWAMSEVMSKDSILDDVKAVIDPQSNESRPFSQAEREKLGVSRLKLGSHDVNYDITAKSKDGHHVGAVIFLKGESDAEVSLLYGVAGDPELSRAILDAVEVALTGPLKDPGITKASTARAPSKKADPR